MSSYHQPLNEDIGGNNQFTSFSSNINDISLISIYWNDINLKPSFCNISLTSSYTDLNNIPTFATIATSGNYNDLTNKPFLFTGNHIYNNNSAFVGIGTNNPQYKLDVAGDINFTGSLNQNNSEFKTSQWINSNVAIYYNLGNIGIGKITNINEKLDINGNIRIEGNIYPATTSNSDLGTIDNKWKDLYLSGNSIYLDNINISKNINNNLEIKDENNNYIGIDINEIELNSNNNNFKIKLNENGILIYNKNDYNYYPVSFNNAYDYSNIIYSNQLLSTSNALNTKINNINTDTITNGTNNRFIVNDIYNRDITFTQNLTTSNLTTNNLNVIGDSTTINTTVYQTEQLQVVNNTALTALYIKQINSSYNLTEFYKNDQLAFVINSNGNIGINNANPLFKLDVSGSLNSSEVLINGTNVSNIIDSKISNSSNYLIDYNNLTNKPSLSSVAISGDYNDLINKTWSVNGNNIYNNNSGFIGLGTSTPNYKLDVNGSLNTTGVLINGTNVNEIIDNKISDNSNILIDYNNLTNKPSLSSVALSGSYNDLLNKPSTMEGTSNYNDLTNKTWINDNNNIYNSNSGFVGIGNINPQYKLDVNGNINTNSEILIKGTNTSNIIDTKISDSSNYLINYNNLTNKPSLTTVATSGSYNDLINKPSLSTVATSGNYNDLINTTWTNSGNNIYNNNSGFVGIGIVDPQYKLDINGSLNSSEVFIKGLNISNIIDNKVGITSNTLNTKINAITTDTIPLGTTNRFIVNDSYNRNITFTQNLTSSNIITSNLSVIGDTTTLNTTVYQTEQLQIINDTTAPPVVIKQLNSGYNVAEFYNNTQPTFIINSNGYIGVSKINPDYNLDVNGNLNSTESLIKGTNISNIIDGKITITSNILINYNNLTNKPSLSTVATSGSYNDLINKTWNVNGNDINNTNSGNTGIGITTPQYKLDVAGNINTNSEVFIKTTNISNIIDSKITITSNILVNYNNLINKPSLATVATSGDYNDLLNKPTSTGGGGVSDYNDLTNKTWINSGTNIYNSNSLNVGIGKTNPQYKLDVIGDININGSLRISNAIIPFSSYSNTNITASNAAFSYSNSSYGYYTFLTNGSITFPQNTNCDVLVVGAGGNGGLSSNAGGGGAGEVIYYPNYPFTIGTSNIIVGYNSVIYTNRISKIYTGSTDIIKALGGGDGSAFNYNISFSGSGNSASLVNSSTTYKYISFINNGSLTLSSSINCDILVVGGGGGGGGSVGSGGGAGGLVYITNYTLLAGTYNITIGSGGTGLDYGSTNSFVGGSGGNTIFYNTDNTPLITALGGGRGRSQYATNTVSGGSGGGGVRNNNTGSLGIQTTDTSISAISRTYGFGNNGGTGTNAANSFAGGGGGGAGAAGGNATSTTAGSGGNGKQINITGQNVYYAGGGGGAVNSGTDGIGGLGGGGAGHYATVGDNGVANSGGGGGGTEAGGKGGNGGSGIVIIRYAISSELNLPTSGGSGGGGYINLSGAAAGTKWNVTYSLVNSGTNGTALQGGNGGSAFNGGYTELITGTNLIMGVGGTGATSTSIPVLRTTYGSGGDGNSGLGNQGIVIIKVPLNTTRTKFDGYINFSNIENKPYINDLVTSKNFIDIGYYNQVNFPLANISLANEWFVYKGIAPTNTSNSLIFWHVNSSVNSKWWFNGTINNTNNEISDERVKKEITTIINPLEKLMLLKPKEYMLCDDKDYLKKYGIIAQDVKKTLPEFVYTDNDYIANIYTNAVYNEELIDDNYCYTLKTTIDISGLIDVNDELKILLNNNDNKNKEIIIEDLPYHNRNKKRFAIVKAIIDNNTIEITEKLELTEIEKLNVFIYGKKVKDFLKLDYSSLYSLNINCCQELYKLIKAQQTYINTIEKYITNIENKNL